LGAFNNAIIADIKSEPSPLRNQLAIIYEIIFVPFTALSTAKNSLKKIFIFLSKYKGNDNLFKLV
jgi:hypothetical protein